MRAPPAGWPRISAALFYEDPTQAIDWLVRAFGFEVRLKVEGEGGSITHSELAYEEGLIMVGGTGKHAPRPDPRRQSPKALQGANTQHLCLYVDDVDTHYARARAMGAKVVRELQTTEYGEAYWADRSYAAEDLEGHVWYFMQRVREATR